MALLSQVSTSYPRVPRDSLARTRACFLILQLSGYRQFMLSTFFLPLRDVDRCIAISAHLISTLTVIDSFILYAFSEVQALTHCFQIS